MSDLEKEAYAAFEYDQTETFEAHQVLHPSVEVLSFDIWSTLLRANPRFGAARVALIAEYLLPASHQGPELLPLVATAVKTADTLLDTVQERLGNQFGPDMRLAVVRDQLKLLLLLEEGQVYALTLTEDREKELLKAIHAAFREFPPTLMEAGLAEEIARLQQQIPVVVVSNTGYVPGHLLRDTLADLGIRPTQAYFSDEIGVGKPCSAMFTPLTGFANLTGVQNVVHVGDSYPADYLGASDCGYTAVLYTPRESFTIQDGDDSQATAWRGSNGVLKTNSLVKLTDILRPVPTYAHLLKP